MWFAVLERDIINNPFLAWRRSVSDWPKYGIEVAEDTPRIGEQSSQDLVRREHLIGEHENISQRSERFLTQENSVTPDTMSTATKYISDYRQSYIHRLTIEHVDSVSGFHNKAKTQSYGGSCGGRGRERCSV